jgi:hypothetical protein
MAVLAALAAAPGGARADDPQQAPDGPAHSRLYHCLHPFNGHLLHPFEGQPPATLSKPCGCYSHFNDYTCGSLRSEWVYIFGSCRDFFGEPCLKRAPQQAGLPPRPAPSIMGVPGILGGPLSPGSSLAEARAASVPPTTAGLRPLGTPGASLGGPQPGAAPPPAGVWSGGCNCRDR